MENALTPGVRISPSTSESEAPITSAVPVDASGGANAVPPRLPFNLWGNTVRGVVAVVITMVSAVAPLGVVALTDFSSFAFIASLQRVGLSAVTAGVAFLSVWAWMRWVERRPFRATGFTSKGVFTGLTLGTMCAAVGVLSAHLIAVALGMSSGEMPDQFPVEPAAAAGAVLEIIALAFLLQGIPEELVFRGWLLRFTRPRPWFAFWFTAGVFTLMHLASQGGQEGVLDYFLYLVTSLGIAVLAAACVIRWDNGWIAAGIHGGFHIGTMVANYTLPAIEPRASWVIPGLIYGVAAAVILRDAARSGQLQQFRDSADRL